MRTAPLLNEPASKTQKLEVEVKTKSLASRAGLTSRNLWGGSWSPSDRKTSTILANARPQSNSTHKLGGVSPSEYSTLGMEWVIESWSLFAQAAKAGELASLREARVPIEPTISNGDFAADARSRTAQVAGWGLALGALEAREQQARGGARQAVGNQELVPGASPHWMGAGLPGMGNAPNTSPTAHWLAVRPAKRVRTHSALARRMAETASSVSMQRSLAIWQGGVLNSALLEAREGEETRELVSRPKFPTQQELVSWGPCMRCTRSCAPLAGGAAAVWARNSAQTIASTEYISMEQGPAAKQGGVDGEAVRDDEALLSEWIDEIESDTEEKRWKIHDQTQLMVNR
ncbi:hypothetical protein F4806DRAFT_497371 [Annulohypoxylon nitens]|nr:hypothetical protein F4806DRAFT_497371 [Annulohypoxylon nitens]